MFVHVHEICPPSRFSFPNPHALFDDYYFFPLFLLGSLAPAPAPGPGMGVPFAGVCAALAAVMSATIVVAAEAPEGPYRESIMLTVCVAFHGGMALLIHGVWRGPLTADQVA